jgi:hypothetical protein
MNGKSTYGIWGAQKKSNQAPNMQANSNNSMGPRGNWRTSRQFQADHKANQSIYDQAQQDHPYYETNNNQINTFQMALNQGSHPQQSFNVFTGQPLKFQSPIERRKIESHSNFSNNFHTENSNSIYREPKKTLNANNISMRNNQNEFYNNSHTNSNINSNTNESNPVRNYNATQGNFQNNYKIRRQVPYKLNNNNYEFKNNQRKNTNKYNNQKYLLLANDTEIIAKNNNGNEDFEMDAEAEQHSNIFEINNENEDSIDISSYKKKLNNDINNNNNFTKNRNNIKNVRFTEQNIERIPGKKKKSLESVENYEDDSNLQSNKDKKKFNIKKTKKHSENNEKNDLHYNMNENKLKLEPSKKNKLVSSKSKKIKNESEEVDNQIQSKQKTKSERPRIDLMILEKKKHDMIKKLENSEKERSPSPINLVRSNSNRRIENVQIESIKNNTNKTILIEYKPKNLIEFSPIPEKARLLSMCSSKEMKDREEQNLLNIFEGDFENSYFNQDQKRWILKVDPDRAIKVFARPAADTFMDDPENLRPPEVLTKTINYILENIVDIDKSEFPIKKIQNNVKIFCPDLNFENIAKFVEDRFRSIRQDFTILNLKGDKNTIDSHEKIARFLILCLNETLDYDAFSGQQSLFKLYVEQLNATLTSLREFYEYVRANNNLEDYSSPYQAEFYAYSILLSIKETFDLVSVLGKIPKCYRNSPIIKLTLKVARSIVGGEWQTFFKILKSKECEYLLSCLMSLYFKEMRSAALASMSHSLNSKIHFQTNIKKLKELFVFEDTYECLDFLSWFGMKTDIVDENDEERLFDLIRISSSGEDANLPRKTNRNYIESKIIVLSRRDIIEYL